MGVDVNVIFQIAGVGIVVAFTHDIGSDGQERICSVGDAVRFYLYFIYGRHDCR